MISLLDFVTALAAVALIHSPDLFVAVQMRLMEAKLVNKSQSGAKTGMQDHSLYLLTTGWKSKPSVTDIIISEKL